MTIQEKAAIALNTINETLNAIGHDANKVGHPMWDAYTDLDCMKEPVRMVADFGKVAAVSAHRSLATMLKKSKHEFGEIERFADELLAAI